MALYDFTLLNSIPTDIQSIPAGAAISMPFTLQQNETILIDCIMYDPNNTKQDYSLRAWISQTPMGSPIPTLPLRLQTWQPAKTAGCLVMNVYDNQITNMSNFPIGLPLNDYFLNVLDLSNVGNLCMVSITR